MNAIRRIIICSFALVIFAALTFVLLPESIHAADYSQELTNGDCNGDDGVDEIDYALISNAWYQGIGDPAYNANADLNGDGGVDEIDYAILSNAWYTAGDSYGTGNQGTGDYKLRAKLIILKDWPVANDISGQTLRLEALDGDDNYYYNEYTGLCDVKSHTNPDYRYIEDYYISVPARGTYSVTAKLWHWLAKEQAQVTTIPTGLVTINNGDMATNDPYVDLALTSEDYTGGSAADMTYRNSGSAWVDWTSFAGTVYSFPLTDSDGVRTVEAKFKDGTGSESIVCNDTIILDRINPSISATCASTSSMPIEVSYSASDALSGIKEVRLYYKKTDASPPMAWTYSGLTLTATTGTFNFIPTEGDGTYSFYVRAEDNAGNTADSQRQVRILSILVLSS